MNVCRLPALPAFSLSGRWYDALYADKPYTKECDFIEEAFKRYAVDRPKKILDIGCGTGGHALELARRGYNVTGIDASRIMIKAADPTDPWVQLGRPSAPRPYTPERILAYCVSKFSY